MADHPNADYGSGRNVWFKGLSSRLLILTIAFVMLSEVLIYAPSVSRYRKDYLEDRIASAHLATLALESLKDQNVTADLRKKLLDQTGTYAIVLRLEKRRVLVVGPGELPQVDAAFDLRVPGFFGWIADAFATLSQDENRVLRVLGPSPKDPEILVEVVLDEWPMRDEMLDYSWRILGLSILISMITAGLVFLSLQSLMVGPMRRITQSMMSFRDNPEDLDNVMPISKRADEIGQAQRELARMQKELRLALRQRQHLAALGAAVTKISHDLRNSLTTAMLVSDRLSGSEDPDVKRVLPRLFTAIDKAVDLCSQTLNFAREGALQISPSRFNLHQLVAEVASALGSDGEGGVSSAGVTWDNQVESEMVIEADRGQLFRAVDNLCRNAVQAGADQILISASTRLDRVCIDISDNGPGLPPQARDNLFTPFFGTTKKSGTGLGLVIVREILRAHGGDVMLAKSDEAGTTFILDLPDRIRLAARTDG